MDSANVESNELQSATSINFHEATQDTSDEYNEIEPIFLGHHSTMERFVNTSWNMKSDDSVQLERDNCTIDWSDPKPMINQENTTSTINLNSSLSSVVTRMSSSLTSGNDEGTELFDDDCSSTSGWMSLSQWSGEQILGELQTGINLLVNNGRFESDDIPGLSSVYMHGPMWIRNLTKPAAVGEGLSLEVSLEHEFEWNMRGDVGVLVYDMYGEIIFRAWIHDVWGDSRTDARIAYYFLDFQGGGLEKESVQMSGSWSGTFKVWYDKDSDSIKADIPGGSFTLVADPTEEELSRTAKTMAIYYGRHLDNYFDSKFIDSIHLSVDTSPETGIPACPLTPAMDGHWFPQEAYSRLYFEINQPYFLDAGYYLRIKIECDQDTYDRTFTVKVDDATVYTGVIYDETGFDDDVLVMYRVGIQKVELQINYGAYVQKGWKLTHFYPVRGNNEPLEVLGEYFPQENIARLTYLARLGPESKINLKLEADQDPIPRTTRVYVDGQFIEDGIGDNAWEWSLGDYTYNSLHEVTIELQYGAYAEWGKKLTINRVHFLTGSVEIDYMSGHAPSQDDLDVLEAYFITMNYNRVEFHLDDLIAFVNIFNLSADGIWPSQQYSDYETMYRDHTGDRKWEWMLCLHYVSWKGSRASWWGLHWGDYGIFLHDQAMKDYPLCPISPIRRTVTLHEYGHHINIIDWWPDQTERYCVNIYCAMSNSLLNLFNYPWYCEHHWSERRWPGW
jgi:hypothetical protein